MFCYRVTKYSPLHRNSEGHYLKSDWTSYSDIGKKYQNSILTERQYLDIENLYVAAILSFMKCLNINMLYVSGLEHHADLQNDYKIQPLNVKILLSTLENGIALHREQIEIVARMVLREYLWCKLMVKDMYVHFGYDYYLYIGSSRVCKKSVEAIETTGLFVELCQSPYQR